MDLAYSKYNDPDVMVPVGKVRDAVLFDMARCAEIARTTIVPDSGSETGSEIARKILRQRT